MADMTRVYLVQHGEKEPLPGDPGLTETANDRDLVPADGESSRQAGARMRAFLGQLPRLPAPVAAVTHGGATIELLRDLLGEEGLPPGLLATGIPPCAVTTVDDLYPVMIASVAHLT
jgi:broad specificity phosphatase PhoE